MSAKFDDEDELDVEPADAPSSAARDVEIGEDINDVWLRHHRQLPENDPSFSIAELLAATAVGAVLMVGVRFLPRGTAALILGLVVLIGLLANAAGLTHRFLRLSIWVLLFLYLAVAAATALSE
ncbi:MAG: hypothetical protein KDA42_06200 [Planctomycetales bacterium]|nr:hypothetical protein [Planctomycetales bacterium]